jgi:WD40 repeat protein
MFTLGIDCSLGRFALSPGSDGSFLAFSTDILTGKVSLYNLTNSTQELVIAAHETPVIRLAFNEKGTLLATASCNVCSCLRFCGG